MIEFNKIYFKHKKTILLMLLLLPALVASISFAAMKYFKAQQKFEYNQIKNPLLNDVYIIDKEVLDNQSRLREKYIITQVASVDEKHVYLKESNFIYLRINEAIKGIRTDKLLTHNFFSNKIFKISKSQLENLYFNGGVPEVGRSNDGMHLYGGIIIARPKHNLIKKQKYRIGTQENQLAISYYQGSMGYEKDWKEAFRLFEQAAEKGNPYSQISLAQMYRDGEAVEVNLERALYWFELAKQQGIASAKDEYAQLCQKITACIK
ncbi:tetratricopeptide repeat protein [Thalassotalea psychrophila]|uniref:Tetratricopeptide repeat protein n=1 Tax=Thalassotalea psychrophila TaxID=3065647 RepID=A0ABY9TPQ0_9GAMM|nr:tetratricopeptide repeat protein [Colwelliaceae bacterium SQ149]